VGHTFGLLARTQKPSFYVAKVKIEADAKWLTGDAAVVKFTERLTA
jgi:hypothetical protein